MEEIKLIENLKARFGTLINVRALAIANSDELFEFLLHTSEYKDEFHTRFFKPIAEHFIFLQDDFLQFLDLRLLDSSFTAYSNKIGLGNKAKKFLKLSDEVVLNFPYKDCVLKGGQSKDDQKRNEILFNEILAKSEIDVLFNPKVFSNIAFIGDFSGSLYTQNPAEQGSLFDENETESHLPETQLNSTQLNSTQLNSTQLNSTQLNSTNLIDQGKARHNLRLAEDGTFAENFLIKGNNLIALHSLKKPYCNKIKLIYIDPPYNTGTDSFNYNDRFNHSVWLTFMKNRLEVARELLRDDGVIFVHLDYNEVHYAKVLMDEIFGKNNFVNEIIWRRKQATSFGKSKFGITNDTILFYSKTDNYDFYPIFSLDDENTKKYIKERFIYDDNDGKGKYMKSPLVNSLYRPNLKYVFHGINPPKNGWLYSQEKMEEFYKNGEIIIPDDKEARIYRKIYLSNYQGQVIQNIWIDIPIVNPMAKEQVDFQTQKPEALLQRIIQCVTNENDLVLDFFAGSGTTLAVAHKMKRRYIGIEQMDYIQNITLERLKKVIDGEQGGISKAMSWQGGGSVIYAELMPLNALFKDKINQATTLDELKTLIKEMQNQVFFEYCINANQLDEIDGLPLNDAKEALKMVLDSNMDYVLYGDIDDAAYEIDDETRAFNQAFYGD